MLLPHDTLLSTFREFIIQHATGTSIDNIPLNSVLRLTALFLRNNRFYYKDKIYRFSRGSPSCFPLTETLSTIFVHQWQRLFLQEPPLRDQFYGR